MRAGRSLEGEFDRSEPPFADILAGSRSKNVISSSLKLRA